MKSSRPLKEYVGYFLALIAFIGFITTWWNNAKISDNHDLTVAHQVQQNTRDIAQLRHDFIERTKQQDQKNDLLSRQVTGIAADTKYLIKIIDNTVVMRPKI